MNQVPIIAKAIINKIKATHKESVLRKENIVVSFDSNIDGIVFLVFVNTGKRPVHLRKIALSIEWVKMLKKVLPYFEIEGRLNKTLKEIENYNESLFPSSYASFELFHFYYCFKPWHIEIKSDTPNEIKESSIEEFKQLQERQNHLESFYKKQLVVSFKVSKWNFKKRNVYLRFGKRFDITHYHEEIENDLFDKRGRRIDRK